MKLPFKKLSFKMKVKLGVLVVFVFIIALVIHEDHAGVVLRKFKPKRALLGKKEANATISSKPDLKPRAKVSSMEKNESAIEKDGKNEKLKTNNKLLLNSFVVYYNATNETSENWKTNSEVLLNSSVVYYHKTNETNINSKAKVSNKGFKRNNTKSNLKVKDVNQNVTPSKMFPTKNETFLNSSKFPKEDQFDTKSNHQLSETDVYNSSESHLQNKQRSIEFEVDRMSLVNSTEFQKSPNNSKNVIPNENTKSESKEIEKRPVVEPINKKNVSFIPEKILGSDVSPTASKVKIDQKKNSSLEQLNIPNNHLEKHSDINPTGVSVDKALNKTKEKLFDSHKQNDQKGNFTNKIDGIPDSDIIRKANETILNQTAMGLESIVSAGFDFLANSEVAKNAALAMEIFNLSDSSITDHIVDDSDSVIDLVRLSAQEEIKISSPTKVEEGMKYSSTIKVKEEINDSSTTKSDVEMKDSSMKVDEEIKDSSPIKIEGEMKDSSAMKVEEEIKDSSLIKIEEENKNSSMEEIQEEIKESSIMTESSVEHDINPVDKKDKKCPPPGICVFWFITRNTCNSDDQCPSTKICCRIRCSKQCIDV